MSVKLYLDNLTVEQRENIYNDLVVIVGNAVEYGGQERIVYPYLLTDKELILPHNYASTVLKQNRPPREQYGSTNNDFICELREKQIVVKKEAMSIMGKNGSVLISAHTGFGKTATAISIYSSCKLKTLVIAHRIVLINQWKDSFEKFCPSAKVSILKPDKADKNDGSDVWIVNAENVPKFPDNFFDKIGLVIADEVHALMAENLSRSLTRVFPRYLLGLSATPYREDGLNKLLDIYFGTQKIIREMKREHIVYKINTGFSAPMEKSKTGRLNWNAVLDWQSKHIERNQLIVDIVCYFATKKFLILVKRIEHGNILLNLLKEKGIEATSMLGTQKKFDKDARVLIGTTNKLGVGFDHPNLDALCLATDVEGYFIQYLGRVFRREDVVPIILDFVDKNPILEKHFETRVEVYEKSGGKIKNFIRNY